MIRIQKTDVSVRVEPLMHAFGFKGGSLSELWQVSVQVTLDNGLSASGQSVQSVLWSDGKVFAHLGQQKGNEAMLDVTRFALQLLQKTDMKTPWDMLDEVFPDVFSYAKKITGEKDLRPTFVLNALTGVDWALWKLHRAMTGNADFDTMVSAFTGTAPCHQNTLGVIPLITYDMQEKDIRIMADEGCSLFKVKIGMNVGGRNNPDEMVAWDIERLRQVHNVLSRYDTPYTKHGKPLYYLDANGRYDTRDRLCAFLDGADKMGALGSIVLLEEPFAEENMQFVGDLPVRIAADESAHSDRDACIRMDECGYTAMALKPIAKTASVSLRVLKEAQKRNVPCFCADLTVNPVMVEVNKRFAAGLPALPGMNIGVFETNGAQNYTNWQSMRASSPSFGKPWAEQKNACYTLDEDYYALDGLVWADA